MCDGERVFGKFDTDGCGAGAAVFPAVHRQGADIRHEIRVPDLHAAAAVGFAGAREGFRILVESSFELVAVVQNKIGVSEQIEQNGSGGHRQQSRRFLSAAVEMLSPGIGGWREQAASLPLEGDLLAFVVPDRRRSAALEDEDDLLEKKPLRRDAFTGRDLEQITVVDVTGPDQIEVGAARVFPGPRRQLNLAQILDIEFPQDRNALRFNPFVVVGLAADLDFLAFDHCCDDSRGGSCLLSRGLSSLKYFFRKCRLSQCAGLQGRGLIFPSTAWLRSRASPSPRPPSGRCGLLPPCAVRWRPELPPA